ncbi:RING-H2 finger protein ATL16-like [Elaeis guineensis]|uniref:RING-type E3 ubiquitin transferase n=1 Tax=Elaeis guineensis var. tenera TaxID=51953 RepID=A0A6I9R324_ELAGV|nr:RING-H2 finger protein ATL16-like [Elaeis guineensis]
MDPTLRPPLTSQPPPPPPSTSSSSYTSFPILVITILGILTTAILLLSYYIFAIKCRLNLRRADLVRRLYFARSRRHQFHMPPIINTTTAPEFRGLDPSTVRSIPIIKFRKAGGDAEAERRTSFNECAVCLNEFQEEEKLRLLPSCSHAFHIDCIDIWLQFNANCPLCRSDITGPIPIPSQQFMVQPPDQVMNGSIVIEVRGDESGAQTPRMEAPNPSPRSGQGKKGRKLHKMGSMGDECINVRGKDERFCVQPIRRSFSMDSSNDRQLYLSVQELLRHNPQCFQEAGGSGEEEASSSSSSSSSGGGGCGRVRRSFFSFGQRSSRTAILPFHVDQ